MFKVSNTVPGFRVEEPGFRVQDFDAPTRSYETPSTGNPYLRPRDVGNWGASILAPQTGSAWISPPAVASGLQSPPAVDTTQDLCRGVGRAGPYCLYQCPDGNWVSSPLYPTGPCPPFIVPGIGTTPWGGPAGPR
jgi:hypothetical protein